MDYEKILELIKDISVKAGEKIMEYYISDFKVEYKEDNSPLTCADKAADDIIIEALKKEFPDYGILSEESTDDLTRLEKEFCWLIDPLDGTKEFVNHTDEFTVNIALVQNGVSILGVVYVPVTKEMYYAYKGGGSFYLNDGVETKIHVSERNENLRLLSSKYHRSEKFLELIETHSERISGVEGIGSSLKGCLIAHGKAEGYYRHGYTCEWDTAAMQIIVEEAGGILKQLDGSPMRYNRVDTLNRLGFYVINNDTNHLKDAIKIISEQEY